MPTRPRILLVEDDPSIRLLLEDELGYQGFDVRVEVEGEAGLRAALEWQADLLLLDLMLPNVSGLEICRTLRAEGINTPILLLTARDQEADKVVGLDSGANDYVTKPFGVAELMARIRAHLRQREMQSEEAPGLQFLDLRLNVRRFQAYRGETVIDLTQREFGILRMLLEAQGGTVSRDEFLDELWPETYVTSRTIDTHVSSLRKKIGLFDTQELILGVRGVGYRLNPDLLDS
ncbi:MAG: response regulator transcription factor [Acidobacteriota bacterium]